MRIINILAKNVVNLAKLVSIVEMVYKMYVTDTAYLHRIVPSLARIVIYLEKKNTCRKLSGVGTSGNPAAR